MNCPQCRTGLEPSARFCGACGFRVGEVAAAGAAPLELAPTSADPYAGTTLNNRFVIEAKLGEGGFGAVYKGVQLGTNRRVAVKLLHPEMTRDPNVVARFRREGQVLCSLRDAHSITTYDFDQTPDGTLFIAMELLEGKSLHDLFQSEAPIAWHRMLKIMSEMCSSLEEAHALGIVHRDLKPENVYLEHRPGNPEFVKVLDFGIAKVVRGDGLGGEQSPQLTATGQTLGTLEYMSPEQLMGKQLTGTSDIYALGVVAYELMTGRLPFPDAVGPAMLISAQLKKVPPPPSTTHPQGNIPPGVDALILKMLAKTPEGRFADVSDLRREIDRLLAGGGMPLGAPPALSLPPRAQGGAAGHGGMHSPPPGMHTPPPGMHTPPPGMHTPPPAMHAPPGMHTPVPGMLTPTPGFVTPAGGMFTPVPGSLAPHPRDATPRPHLGGGAPAPAGARPAAAAGGSAHRPPMNGATPWAGEAGSTREALDAASGSRWLLVVVLVIIAIGGAVGVVLAIR